MLQKYIVFLNDRRIEIISNSEIYSADILTYTIQQLNKTSILAQYKRFKEDLVYSKIVFIAKNYSSFQLFTEFSTLFKNIFAAGGIVRNNKNEILFIRRFGVWDLPKGKKEKKEILSNTALREVIEETGLTDLYITKSLETTYHIYTDKKGNEVLKSTIWFEMFYSGNQIAEPQTLEGIEEVRWFSINEIDSIYQNTYASIKELIENYLQMD